MVQQQGSPQAPQSVIDAVINVESRVADFIANGPSDGIGGYVRDRYRARCDEYANAPAWARALANAPSGSLNRICSPWFDSRGFDGPQVNSRGSGGQCPGVLYNVTRFATNTLTGAPVVTVFNSRIGPITLERGEEPEGGCPVFFNGWSLKDGAGNTISASGDCSSNFAANWSYSAVRTDGQPDTCGDQDPFFEPGNNPPPDPGPQPGPEPTEDPRNPFGPPLLPIPPYEDPTFGPTPVTPPDDAPGGGAPVNPENGPGDPGAVGDPVPGAPGEGGEGEDVAFGDPPEGRAWVGCYVQLDVPGDYGDIPGSRPGNAVFPRVVGNVSLIHGDRRSQAVQLRSEWTDIFRASPAQPVDGARVNVLPSISYLVYPVSVPLCPESTCPPPGGEEPPAT